MNEQTSKKIGTVGGKIVFYNFTDEVFNGRFAGVNYQIGPKEYVTYDSDKHYMLILLSKQLADRELLKLVKGVGRNPMDSETWGKSLDEKGKPFVITSELRKEYMKKAVADLVEKPIHVPEEDKDHPEEAGSTAESNARMKTLENEIEELKTLITKAVDKGIVSSPEAPPTQIEDKEKVTNSMYRQSLIELAQEHKVVVTPEMTKQDIIDKIKEAGGTINE